jgi:hypothetical protein
VLHLPQPKAAGKIKKWKTMIHDSRCASVERQMLFRGQPSTTAALGDVAQDGYLFCNPGLSRHHQHTAQNAFDRTGAFPGHHLHILCKMKKELQKQPSRNSKSGP